ncbi:uncharacterized protein EI90DRAFT_3030538 [Cantharellus anzutake]|uniref:uncharacterized protein n=1 Tax=Cantharellus anzutake TaxID=1750568 RepID=UPI00190409BD|nr:uncharacterized protein EI90DRAFT_3030538 [Cantharellus anzutake]KAF8342877.1 hypothetical protein EI90DRAFT_3030538 [Cantharellus anzutake]
MNQPAPMPGRARASETVSKDQQGPRPDTENPVLRRLVRQALAILHPSLQPTKEQVAFAIRLLPQIGQDD